MGWEMRHGGRLYLYWNRRVGGKPVKEYLGSNDLFGFGLEAADRLDRLQRREAKARSLTRKAQRKFRARADDLLAAVGTANADLRAVVDGTLYAIGFHKHNRGEWRMSMSFQQLQAQIKQNGEKIEKLSAEIASRPLLNYPAPANDAEAVAVYAKARAGDVAAQEQVRALIVARGWVNWVGDLGNQATHQLIHKAASSDPVWRAGMTEKAEAIRKEFLGQNPTILEQLLVRRIVNGWIATHTLELELSVRPPADLRSKEHLDRALTRAQKRMTEAIGELARVRRLQAPRVLAQLQVVANQGVVNANPNPVQTVGS